MRLVRFKFDDRVRVGVVEEGQVWDLSGTVNQFTEALSLATRGQALVESISGLPRHPLADVELLVPIEPGSNIFAVGANYRAHAAEAGLIDSPDRPVIFTKLYESLAGPEQPLLAPRQHQMDYEAELAVVIGKAGKNIAREEALEHVAGYTIANDVTARDMQWMMLGNNRIVDWLMSKCLPQSSPLGPWVVTADELRDPSNLLIRSWVNSELRQNESSALMVHDVPALISYLSRYIPLKPGDVLLTGTPKGVGGFDNRFLTAGDVVKIEIEGIGELTNTVVEDQ